MSMSAKIDEDPTSMTSDPRSDEDTYAIIDQAEAAPALAWTSEPAHTYASHDREHIGTP